MLFSNPRKFTLTLFVYSALLLALSASASAHIQQRDHANLKRLIKKRSPFPQDQPPVPLGPVAGAGAAVPTFPTASASTTTATESATASESSSASETSSSTSETSESHSHSASETSSATTVSTSSTESSTSSAASTTSTSTTAIETTTSSAPPVPTSESLAVVGVSNPTSKGVVTLTASVDAEETSTPPKIQSSASKAAPPSTTLTVIIVIASSLAGLTILWTIFRKWKLGRSKKFDERLQPIDWQPTNPDDALPGSHRRLSGASSFRSGSGHPTRGYGGSDHGHDGPSSYAIPDHDFTAGASLAPVGGYADLARGPSPQPQMNQMSRGPTLTHPTYDANVPLHHQAGYGTQDAYDYGGSRRY
ncbi:hypothetical protein DXG03_008935 [Asterophora parasitica]|uniref:Uncharacterized protein n=1 Tax=Asterophora parasitica TaxID=117018 RepID=A0A9P7GBL0_9AGAR|nr:hypothetical protein DXG03_008935 [Asterophora parasitica]